MPRKLDSGEIHVLRLMKRDAGLNGWCKTSHIVMKLVKDLPPELVEYEVLAEDGSGSSRLRPAGIALLNAMEWLYIGGQNGVQYLYQLE
jgi:hypothetical protein